MRLPDGIQSLTEASFQMLRGREFRPSCDLIGLKFLREKAGRERDLRELYRGRALYELLQNADDAGARKAVYVLAGDGLAFAHDGQWFTVDNFRSLADGWSDKDPDKCIGHKGIGFRSVLDITPAPHLVKVDREEFLAVKFSFALNNGHIQETLDRDEMAREQYTQWTQYGQSCCPIMAIPGTAKKQFLGSASQVLDALLREVYGASFTTLFWFPAKDPDILPIPLAGLSPSPIVSGSEGRRRLSDFLRSEVGVLLPFLRSVRRVSVYDLKDAVGDVTIIEDGQDSTTSNARAMTVKTTVEGKARETSFFQMAFSERRDAIPPDVRNDPETPRAIKSMTSIRAVLSVVLDDGQPSGNPDARFHVYFPTEEPTGLGFVVHGDFYVKPDRTRLMAGKYNTWLLSRISRCAAGPFLDELLERYRPRNVFDGLGPTGKGSTHATALVDQFAKALQDRKKPFVPTRKGLRPRHGVVLPPTVDVEGFWDTHFGEDLPTVVEGKVAFLAPEQDCKRTRSFLDLASVKVLEPAAALSFLESDAARRRGADWWYECYCHIASHAQLNQLEHRDFVGRRLILLGPGEVAPVPRDREVVVCLPPGGDATALRVPDLFDEVFVFVDGALAQRLIAAKGSILSWICDRFRISRFEATDLLPRAVRRVAPDLFNGTRPVTGREIAIAWAFMKAIVEASRGITEAGFWNDIGRFPVPTRLNRGDEILSTSALVPAFLAYWPDSLAADASCLAGVPHLRRVDEGFIEDLCQVSSMSLDEWQKFLKQVGLSGAPKLLRYSRRVAAEDTPLLLETQAPGKLAGRAFAGERQSDENQAAISVLATEPFWDEIVRGTPSCAHDLPREVQNLSLVEGLAACARKAAEEFEAGEESWSALLWSLVRCMAELRVWEMPEDSIFCRGGGPSGHAAPLGRYLHKQLRAHGWLPSSLGPASLDACFVRFATRRLISSGVTGTELGDALIPYVVVNNVDDQAVLQKLGVPPADDVSSASPDVLCRILHIMGERLASDWGQHEIMAMPPRWRLVRGAIQDIYRALNQQASPPALPSDARCAVRTASGVRLEPRPWYFARPGSAVERAFAPILPLFDCDRAYERLFEQFGVIRLTEGETVDERFLAVEEAKTAPVLYEEIVNRLAPPLLGAILATSDRPREHEAAVRRLHERFEVKTAPRLTVAFTLRVPPHETRTVDHTHFYLQRSIVATPGAITEAHFTLYVTGHDVASLSSLDGDALGEALVPVFMDTRTEPAAALFPRIASRYTACQGDPEDLGEFLRRLGVPEDAVDQAHMLISGETPEPLSLPPQPVLISSKKQESAGVEGDRPETVVQQARHRSEMGKKTDAFLSALFTSPSQDGSDTPSAKHPPAAAATGGLTPEQQERGRQGEEEIKRRLCQPGGWAGFMLAEDRRDDRCGYDFLCLAGDRHVELEIKTFAPGGRVVLSSAELRAAAIGQGDYYLVGILDDGGAPSGWRTYILCDPLDKLLAQGEMDVDAKLVASADVIFVES